jgi:hypothetical protein
MRNFRMKKLSNNCQMFAGGFAGLSGSEAQSKISGAQIQDTLNSLSLIQHQHSRAAIQ